MAASKIKAAVFDFDGMIIDTRDFLLKTYGHALSAHGYPRPTANDFYPFVGQHINVGLKQLAPNMDVDLVLASYREFHDNNLHLISTYNDLEEILKKLKAADLKLAVFTARGHGAKDILKKFKILKYFDTVVTSADVTNHKPHPEGLLKALKIIGVKPKNAAMFGDSVYDIKAGKQAKVALTIAVTHGFGTRKDLVKAGPDYIIDSLSEIPAILLDKMRGDES